MDTPQKQTTQLSPPGLTPPVDVGRLLQSERATHLTLAAQPEMAAVGLKIPAFWPGDPELWFGQVEAQLSTRKISDQRTKFAHVVASLDKEYVSQIRDLILTPPSTAPYDRLKEALIRRTGDTEASRLQQLLAATELGDRKPSQLLRQMQRLLSNKILDAAMFRQLFLQRLPLQVVMVLEASASTVSLPALAETADKLMHLHHQSFSRGTAAMEPIQQPAKPPHAELQELLAEIAALAKQVKHLANGAAGDTSRSSRAEEDICFFHRRFGKKARKCRPPCAFSAENSPARN